MKQRRRVEHATPTSAGNPRHSAPLARFDPCDGDSRPVIFSQSLSIPVGIATNGNGRIWVASDAVTSALLTGFESGCTSIGYASDIGAIWVMGLAIEIQLLDPSSGQLVPAIDLRSLPIDASSIFDLASGAIG